MPPQTTLEAHISTLKNIKGDINALYQCFLQWPTIVPPIKEQMDQLEVQIIQRVIIYDALQDRLVQDTN